MASSPTWYSHAANKTNVPPAPWNRPMMVALSQGYSVPPHSRAMKNMIANGANKKNPTRSSFDRVDIIVAFLALVLSRRSGIFIRSRKVAERTPIGRLM